MFVLMQERNGEEVSRRLLDSDVLDCDVYAAEFASMYGVQVAKSDGFIPDGCGDFRITLLEDLNNRTRIWSSAEYFVDSDTLP